MRGLIWIALVALVAGCVAANQPVTVVGLRDLAAPLSSQVDATPARLAGDWVVRMAPRQGGLAPGAALRFGALEQVGPGRFRTSDGPLAGRELWVVWLDADNRTAALATPQGDQALILDRTAQGGADRMQAAREVLAWQGFDLRFFQGV